MANAATASEVDHVRQDLAEYFRLVDRKRDGALRDDMDLYLVERKLREKAGAPAPRMQCARYGPHRIF